MAILEFKCLDCGKKFEKRTSYSDKDKVSCPVCGTIDIKLVPSLSAERPDMTVREQ